MAENKNNEVQQEELAKVSGGEAETAGRWCFFTSTGRFKEYRGVIWGECASRSCTVLPTCSCLGVWNNCTDRWHRMTDDHQLAPRDFANHKKKYKENDYND